MGERARRFGLTGDSVPPSERIRAATVVVLASWTVFVIAGSSFAKLSEHFDTALPNGAGAHHLADVAYTVVQAVATVAGLMVAAGAALAVPAFVRFLRSGGWHSLQGHVIRAATATVVAGGMSIPLLLWAHRLTDHQRNGGLTGYGVFFLIWAALAAVTLGLWSVAAAAAVRRIPFSPRLLFSESFLAIAVALTMLGITAATAVWSATIASKAPSFFGVGPLADPRLAATFGFMALGATAALGGAIRIARTWRMVGQA
jgi:hypothetical protein